MRYVGLAEVILLHERIIAATGGREGLRDLAALESAVAQPRMTFENRDLYPSLEEKAAALGYALIQNHSFMDGNKRIGHAAMEAMLLLNGRAFSASVDDAEQAILGVASGAWSRDQLTEWVRTHVAPGP